MGIVELLAKKKSEAEGQAQGLETSASSPSTLPASSLKPRTAYTSISNELLLFVSLVYKSNLFDFENLELLRSFADPPIFFLRNKLSRPPELFRSWRLMRLSLVLNTEESIIWEHIRQMLVEERNFSLDKKSLLR